MNLLSVDNRLKCNIHTTKIIQNKQINKWVNKNGEITKTNFRVCTDKCSIPITKDNIK